MEIPEFIQEETPTDPSATYYIYLSLFVPEFPQKNAEIVLNLFLNGSTEVTKEVAVTFSKYPHSYQLSFSRCALYFPDKFTLLSLERLSLLLMKSGRPHLQNDGIKLSSFITNPTSPRDLFTSIVTSGPYLSTIEAARSSWSTALKILNSMNEENKFHTLRLVLESPETPEATLCVIIQELKRIIHSSKSGLFRSPMVGNTLLPLIMNPNVTRNPVGKTELLVTSLNFLQYLLIVDKRIHCFALFGNQNQMKNIQKAVDEVKVALKKSKSDNEKPKEKILENMKKVNFGKELTRNDIDKVVESTNLSIARVQFNVELIEEVLNAN
ncbi:hypothetical protein GPJ56_008912 [Histomonas meleagridis]|uniref:uncharacterized protein n=1 Tax=Histomonas meleagridis TaxID=135588 RepID=UPI00355A1C94|nr:hypothetical protein GPJ56_008912 [Histomonas meleagridis]KAH0797838.1 hypothetical protein GO595_009467 [Histomonas meleagridis]